MKKLEVIEKGGQTIGYSYLCPGCKLTHEVIIKPHINDVGASWEFSGDLKSPTFTPSILSKVVAAHKTMICHSYVRGGMIYFLNDCTHALAGQTVPMPDIDIQDFGDYGIEKIKRREF